MRGWGIGALALLLGACGGGGAGDSLQGPASRLTLGVADAPVDDAEAVWVVFSRVELQHASGELRSFTFDTPQAINLLDLVDGKRVLLLDEAVLAVGQYNFIRLYVDANLQGARDSYIQLKDGTEYPLYIPSGSESGLKLNTPFTVAVGQQLDFTIDFDLRKSVHKPKGQAYYFLRPTLRLVDNADAGAIAGTVDATLLTAPGCTPDKYAVYVYGGTAVIPNDVGSFRPPLSSAAVHLDAEGQYRYHAAFLPEGNYTVAFTCQAGNDDPEADDAITFVGPTNVGVVAGKTSVVDF